MDGTEPGAQPDGVRPRSEVFAEMLSEAGVTQQDIGDVFSISQQAVSDWKKKGPPMDRLPAVEARLGFPKGELLRRAGYILREATTRDAIATDTDLSPYERAALVDSYDAAVRRTIESRTGNSNAPSMSPASRKRAKR